MTQLFVQGCGIRAAIGMSSLGVVTALRAGVSERRPSRIEAAAPRTMIYCEEITTQDDERLVELAASSLAETYLHLPAVLAVPANVDDPDALLERIHDVSETPRHPDSRVVSGDPHGLLAFGAAMELLDDAPAVLVGGVDSFHRAAALPSPEAPEVFGEAAAWLLVSRSKESAWGALENTATADDLDSLFDDMGARDHPSWLVHDAATLPARRDVANAAARAWTAQVPCLGTASQLGVLGAASAAVHVALICRMWSIGAAPERAAIVTLLAGSPAMLHLLEANG